jgi:hypothetical protein
VLDTTYGAINRVTGARDKVRNRYVPAGFKEQLPSSATGRHSLSLAVGACKAAVGAYLVQRRKP